MVSLLSRQLNQIPSMVILIDSKDIVLAHDWGYQPGLWMKYTPGHRAVSLTCPGIGLVQRGVWPDLSASLGGLDTVCNMRNRQLRIAHNTWPPFFAVTEGVIDDTTLESIVIKTFLEKHSLEPVWVHAGQVWGNIEKTTGKWNGIVGLVRLIF